MKKTIFRRIFFIISFTVLFGLMVANTCKEHKYYVFNKNNGKLYRYYLLKPGEKYTKNFKDVDSLIVYSRLIVSDSVPERYSYLFSAGVISETVDRKVRISKNSRGVSGDKVSSWNNYKYYTQPADNEVTIKNNSPNNLLVKVNFPGKKAVRSSSASIAYPPDSYDNCMEVMINEKAYTYYSAGEQGLSLQLSGPLKIKVISRLIVEEVEKLSYSWRAFMDEKEILTVEESSPYSSSHLSDGSSIVTRGKTEIFEIPAGVHSFNIKDMEHGSIIYRLYIDKSALGNN